jgi:hypothetical protein
MVSSTTYGLDHLELLKFWIIILFCLKNLDDDQLDGGTISNIFTFIEILKFVHCKYQCVCVRIRIHAQCKVHLYSCVCHLFSC